MAISKRGNSWQAYVSVDGQRIRKSFPNKEDATVWEALARQAILNGKPVPEMQGSKATSQTLTDAADACYTMFWAGGKSDDKMVQYIGQLTRYFGPKYPISNFTTEVVDKFILDCKNSRNSNATINRKLAALSKILRYANELGKLDAMPTFHRQKEGKNRIRWLTKDEELAILDTLENWGQLDIKDAAIISIDTGIRHGELCRIKVTDITPDGLYIGESKNDTPRLVPLTKRSRDTLQKRKRQVINGRIFPKANRDWHRTTWERVRNHLDLDDVVWHTFRHTTCSRLVQGGVPLLHVKEWMGHLTIQTTMRYAHLAPKHLQEIVGVLE